ncbi:hypothetical protein CS535_16025 [Yersinia massiliensis]|nr:hypothetical protein CS535_16025 [Yersinia massiliensis]
MFKEKRKLYRYEFINEIGGLEGKSAKDVIEVIFGDHENESDYRLVRAWFEAPPQKLWQRLNYLWVFPLYLISVPFQWLFIGRIGLNRDSKVGVLIERLIGNYQ